MTVNSPKLNEALNELRRQMEAIVREEQLRDQLTGLANNLALSEKLKSAIEDRIQFWCAIIEVDYFKRINDKFTYAVADGLLQKIAARLKLFEDYVPGAFAVRAHGDEFYLIGSQSDSGTETKIADSLDQIRKEIENIRIRTDHGEMGCTVSIGVRERAKARESEQPGLIG